MIINILIVVQTIISACYHYRHALSSIASSNACEGDCESEMSRTMGVLRYTQSLDVITPRKPTPSIHLLSQINQRNTSRSLDIYTNSAQDMTISTVSGLQNSIFNGNVVGVTAEGENKDEDSPLLRKCSLYNKLEQPKKKVQDSNYIEFYKKWRSLENLPDAKNDMQRKMPRFAIRSWLIGIFSGGATRSSSTSLRRPAPLLDRDTAV